MTLVSETIDTVAEPGEVSRGAGRIVLAGNPNVGKSLLFKHLTNHYVVVSNYPGTTVEVVRAKAHLNGREFEVIDTPGVNDLTPRAEDARVTMRLLSEQPDATIVQVADSKNLRRALLLTLQLIERNQPMLLVLNMADELEERGGRIQTERLSEILGIPVVVTVASEGRGVDALREAIPHARFPDQTALGDESMRAPHMRLNRVKQILAETYSISPPAKPSFRIRLGFWAMHPVKGIIALLSMVFLVFWFVGLFGAGTLVDLLEVGLFEQRISPVAIHATDAMLPFPHDHEEALSDHSVGLPVTPVHEVPILRMAKQTTMPAYTLTGELSFWQEVLRFIHDFLVGPFGLITMALSYALAIILPIVTTFFFIFSILEDSGYFPRMAIMLNRVLRTIGLNGKAVLPMILGLGCATMATMTTRILETRKERVITTMLLALAVPCSAQLGVLLALMAALSPVATFVWLAIMLGVLLSVGWMSARLLGGETSEFILEIPPLRTPKMSNVSVKTVSRLNWYLREVIPIFVAGTALLFLLDRINALAWISKAAEPLVAGWLGLPAEMSNALLVGFMRRDFGAVYLLDAAISETPIMNPLQILVAMVVITLFMPCIANLLMIAKEHGGKVAWRISAFIFPFAIFLGGVVHFVGKWLTS
ncbi:MAG TPA: ferrous iron transporter B [Rhodothermales bacterium]|nr:ferrous iron transporter B [Rhodothermales bacterium]